MVAGCMSRVASRQTGATRAARNNREALPGRPADAAGSLPLRGDELLSKKRILRNQFNATANKIRSQPGNEPKKIDHGSSLTPSTCGWNL
jgi:hypothetical protein